jgi:hypothetical protein
MARNITLESPVVHVRFNGRSSELRLSALGLALGSNDEQIKFALARQLEVPAALLDAYVIDRHANGNLTLRPEAVFG